jgi:hypothetical protein
LRTELATSFNEDEESQVAGECPSAIYLNNVQRETKSHYLQGHLTQRMSCLVTFSPRVVETAARKQAP